MNITILNGNPGPSTFDRYLAELTEILRSSGHTVNHMHLRGERLQYCIGCFGCWVKTPGVCSCQDGSSAMSRAVIGSDFTLWASPLRMGFPSALLKTAMDKSIPLLHPYFVVAHGEAHHRKRYRSYPRLGLVVEREVDTDPEDLDIIANLFSRTAVNMKSRLEFCLTSETPAADIASMINFRPRSFVKYEKHLPATTGGQIEPPHQLVLFNGSPRGKKGNTPILLGQFGDGFDSVPGNTIATYHLNRMKDMRNHRDAFAEAECAWIGFPLYTDAMPGMVKAFFEALETLKGRKNNPPTGFLVQSGFPEALHSRYVERYLVKLAKRLGAPYLGTIVKGGGEGVRMMPEDANRDLFIAVMRLGKSLAEEGKLDPDLLPVIGGVERYPAILTPVFKVFLRLPIASRYWDTQLKQNGVFEQRFTQPFEQV